MKNFIIGMTAGIIAGAGILLAVHPMSKKDLKKACHRAGKMMHRVSCSMH